ncbi:MAG: flagellar hook-associated protein FlgK [Desulfuromonadaceae bacterium]|nr:flagellar hook-associated protein FlgK [Desulfuromonadaceae bacterium]MDD2854025.1 flagellar hook-associated protein FlgK [Desulfuromonadaceae bacterium]
MSLSSTIEIGKNGLNIYRVAQEVTGENIANVNTPGYSRQRVLLETAPPTSHNGFPLGTGVKIASVERYYDGLLQQQLTNAETTQGYDTTKSMVLQQIEPSFNEVSSDGIGTAISNYFSAWQDLTLNPAGASERQVVMTRGQILADNFHSVSKALNDSITVQNDSLVPLTESINNTLSNIARLNGQIRTTELVSGNANEIRDQRDQLIRELSQKTGITFTENLDGTTDVFYADNGSALVIGSTSAKFSLRRDTTADNYDVMLTAAQGSLTIVRPTSGELGATVVLRDSIIPYYLTQVDTLAKSIIDAVNSQHSAGYSPVGLTGQNFFSPTVLAAGSAAGFSLDAGLSVNNIAASGNIALSGDNSNALLIAKLTGAYTVPSETPSSTFSSFYNSLVSKVGLDVQASKTTVTQDEAFTKQLSTLRESNSGVSLDEELTNLVKYQRSYQASAKLITTATEMMDVVIAMVR